MTFLYYVVLTLHIIACAFLIGVVLLQQGKGQDLASAFGGGGSQAAFGPRGSATVLTRATAILAGVFMVTSLSLSLVRPRERSLLDQLPTAPAATTPAEAPATDAPAPGDAPAAQPEEAAPADQAAPAASEEEQPQG